VRVRTVRSPSVDRNPIPRERLSPGGESRGGGFPGPTTRSRRVLLRGLPDPDGLRPAPGLGQDRRARLRPGPVGRPGGGPDPRLTGFQQRPGEDGPPGRLRRDGSPGGCPAGAPDGRSELHPRRVQRVATDGPEDNFAVRHAGLLPDDAAGARHAADVRRCARPSAPATPAAGPDRVGHWPARWVRRRPGPRPGHHRHRADPGPRRVRPGVGPVRPPPRGPSRTSSVPCCRLRSTTSRWSGPRRCSWPCGRR